MSNLPVFLTGLASGPVIAAAAWMLATMAPVESISVPSQSKTISSKRLAIVRKVASIRLPGGIVLCWRSTVP